MRLLIQLVKEAKVTVDGKCVGSIGNGMLIFLGVHVEDSQACADWLAEKLSHLRVFSDGEGKMNLSLNDVGGSVLIVSQFTLYGECTQGRRPSFIQAARPELAKGLYEYFISAVRARVENVETGAFGEQMEVSLVNHGPATFILEKNESFI